MTAETVRAHAKVNLALAVAPPEPAGTPRAGWHRIATWMHAIDLHDVVELERLPPGARSQYDIAWAHDAPRQTPIDWPPERDLAVRAHRVLEAHAGRFLPVRLRITKRIPVGGGLGGGSSDAAAALMGLVRLFGLDIPRDHLARISGPLGSDIAFFLDGATPPPPALVTGFGDRVDRLPERSRLPLVLVIPPFGCATPAVYGSFDVAAPAPFREDEMRARATAGWRPDTSPFNDLTPAAERVAPALADLRRRAASATGRPVHMTGSGSTLFIAAADDGDAESLAGALGAAAPDAAIVITHLA